MQKFRKGQTVLKIKRICNNIWKLIEKRQQLKKVHLGKRKQDPDCHGSGKTRRAEKVLLKKIKKKKTLWPCSRKQTHLAWLPDQEISICISACFLSYEICTGRKPRRAINPSGKERWHCYGRTQKVQS